jgi:hypothetical protein
MSSVFTQVKQWIPSCFEKWNSLDTFIKSIKVTPDVRFGLHGGCGRSSNFGFQTILTKNFITSVWVAQDVHAMAI